MTRAPLVLLHGWGLGPSVWSGLREALSTSRTVLAPSLPGHSGDSRARASDLDAWSDALAADLAPGTLLCGWSLGGMLAATLAAAGHPSIRRLVLIATTPRFVAGPDWRHGLAGEVVEEFAGELERDYRGLVRRFLSLQARGDEQAAALLRTLRAQVFARGEPDRAALHAGLDILRQADLRESAGRIGIPTLVIAGERDRLTLPGAASWLAGHIPGARLVMIPGAGHAPFLSHPRRCLAACLEFLGPAQVRRLNA